MAGKPTIGAAPRFAAPFFGNRLLYPSPLIAAPSVLVIDIPPANRAGGLGLGRYYASLIESEVEREELEASLDAPLIGSTLPDVLDHRPSNL